MKKKRTALITGATSGIGFELVKLFAADSIDLLLVSRNKKKLLEIKKSTIQEYKINVDIIACDLAVPNSASKVLEFCLLNKISIDYLVNNAGFGIYGHFIENNLADVQEMINLNILSLTEMTKFFLVNMKKNKFGKVLNVASVAAFQPGPLMSVYSATKHFVLAFSEALSEELSDSNVSITVLCPGPTISGFQKRAGFPPTARLFTSPFTYSSKQVAVFGYKKLMNKKRIAIPGIANNISYFLVRFIPKSILTRITKKIFEYMH